MLATGGTFAHCLLLTLQVQLWAVSLAGLSRETDGDGRRGMDAVPTMSHGGAAVAPQESHTMLMASGNPSSSHNAILGEVQSHVLRPVPSELVEDSGDTCSVTGGQSSGVMPDGQVMSAEPVDAGHAVEDNVGQNFDNSFLHELD